LTKNILNSKPWYDALALLVKYIGEERFETLLLQQLGGLTPLEHAVVIGYPAQGRPFHICNNLPEQQLKPTLETYLGGAYLLDPFYSACHEPLDDGSYRLRQLAPDAFYESEYYRSYYAGTRLSEEVGLLLTVDESLRVVISLGARDTERAINAADLTPLEACWPLFAAMCQRHWLVLRPSAQATSKEASDSPADHDLRESLDLAFQHFGRDYLSERECEIVRYILKGQSSRSIAQCLSISTDTVKAHRKHIHAKLGITSQAELFSLFLGAISTANLNSVEDPLGAYYAAQSG